MLSVWRRASLCAWDLHLTQVMKELSKEVLKRSKLLYTHIFIDLYYSYFLSWNSYSIRTIPPNINLSRSPTEFLKYQNNEQSLIALDSRLQRWGGTHVWACGQVDQTSQILTLLSATHALVLVIHVYITFSPFIAVREARSIFQAQFGQRYHTIE